VESSRIKQLQDHRRSVGPTSSSHMTSPRLSLTPGTGSGPGGSNLMSAEYMAAFQNMTLDDCELMQVIGVGGFGRVRLAKVKSTNQIIVLKTQSKKAIMESHMESVIINEIQLMREMKHPYIARLYCAFQDNSSIHMAMELLQGGDFFALLKREIKFSEEKCIFYSAIIVLALEALHSVKIAYRDLKPENLVLNHRGFLKLVDFGLAKRIKKDGKTWTLCGTTDYMAPEILNDKGHSCPVDWWALGALLYEMIDGFPPFYHENQMKVYHKILHAQPKFSEGFNTDAADLITKLLIKNPADRLCYKTPDGVSEIQKHPWFRSINWKSLMRGTVRPPYKPTLSGCTDTTYFEDCASTDDQAEQYEVRNKMIIMN